MRILSTYTGVEVPKATINFSSMPTPSPSPIEGESSIQPLDFVILKSDNAGEVEEAFLRTYYEEHRLRPAIGFELATLQKKFWLEAKDDDFSNEATKKLMSLSQTIALGDTHDGKFVFVADNFWDYMLSIVDRPQPHFKIAAVRLAPT